MPIRDADDLTARVLAAAARTPDARMRELLGAGVRHLHAFVREANLTEPEFRALCAQIARAGRKTDAAHNEVMLIAGTLGVSALVCLVNHGGEGGGRPTTSNLLGPFWRDGAPREADGASIVRSPTPGLPVFATVQVVDAQGVPVAGAEVDVWHASPEGYYENQDPAQADMNLRGRFVSGDDGRVRFRTVRPAGYPVPVDGPAGALLRAQVRHNLRPAHLHVMVHKPGFLLQHTQLYDADDPNLDDDSQWGATQALVVRYAEHHGCPSPAPDVAGPWLTMTHRLVLEPGTAGWPIPPITGKSEGPRPGLVVLKARG